MISAVATPMQYLVCYALTFAAGVVASQMWRLHGDQMKAEGRREGEKK